MSDSIPTETVFSSTDEDYSYDSLEEAVEDAATNCLPPYEGQIVTVWEGEKEPIKASDFLHRTFDDHLQDMACDNCGEAAYDWTWSKDDNEVLMDKVRAAIDEWATETNNVPTFYNIGKTREIEIEFTGEMEDEFKVIKEGEWK